MSAAVLFQLVMVLLSLAGVGATVLTHDLEQRTARLRAVTGPDED